MQHIFQFIFEFLRNNLLWYKLICFPFGFQLFPEMKQLLLNYFPIRKIFFHSHQITGTEMTTELTNQRLAMTRWDRTVLWCTVLFYFCKVVTFFGRQVWSLFSFFLIKSQIKFSYFISVLQKRIHWITEVNESYLLMIRFFFNKQNQKHSTKYTLMTWLVVSDVIKYPPAYFLVVILSISAAINSQQKWVVRMFIRMT